MRTVTMQVETTYDGRHERWVKVTATLDAIVVVERELANRYYPKTGNPPTNGEHEVAIVHATRAATSRAQGIMAALVEADEQGFV